MANFDLSKVSQKVINFIDQVKNEDGDSTNKLSKKEVDKISEYLAGNADTLTNEDKIYIEKEISKSLDQEVYKEITSKDPKLFNDEECKLEIESDLPKKERIKKNPDGSFDMDISGAHGSYKEIIKAFYPELLDNMQLIDAIHLFKDACGIDRKTGYIPNKITIPAELGGIKLDEKSAELYFKLIDNMDKHVCADNEINHHRNSMVRGKDRSFKRAAKQSMEQLKDTIYKDKKN